MRSRFCWTLAVLVLCQHAQAVAAEENAKPNFIVINMDDLGYADIGPFGSTLHRTPHLDTWEGGMRVPTVAWWPGKIPAGTSSDAITGMMDVLPTLVTLAGDILPTDRKFDGANLAPLLLFGTPDAKPVREVFCFYRGLKLEAVRSGSWKLHLEQGALYNLETDIGETNSVASANSEMVAKLRSIADQMQDDLGLEGIGPGCRPLGNVSNAQPLIKHEGQIRAGFEAK